MTLSLSFTCEIQSNLLEISYTVRNQGDSAVYLFDVPWRYVGSAIEPQPSDAYVSVDVEHHELRVGKIIHPVPRLKVVEQTSIPLAHMLAAKSVYEARCRLPVPVRESSPYYPPGESTIWAEAAVSQLEFQVSCLRQDEGVTEKTVSDGILYVWHHRLMRSTETLSAKAECLVSTLRRLDAFERF